MKTTTVNPRHTVEPIGENWEVQMLQLASDTHKAMYLSTRFNGNGDAVVTFVIRQSDTADINFVKCDEAIARYNSMP